jgi:hypothetical protein
MAAEKTVYSVAVGQEYSVNVCLDDLCLGEIVVLVTHSY